MTRNFSAKDGEGMKKGSRLFRRLRCEKVALRAAGSWRSLRKSAISFQPPSRACGAMNWTT